MFDTNALFRGCIRTLIRYENDQARLAPFWSAQALDELVRVVMAKDGNLGRIASDLGWLHGFKVEAASDPIEGFRDAADAHVVHAARQAQASLIVTENLRDFRARNLAAWGIQVLKPDDFFVSKVSADWPVTPEALRAAALVKTAKALRMLREASG